MSIACTEPKRQGQFIDSVARFGCSDGIAERRRRIAAVCLAASRGGAIGRKTFRRITVYRKLYKTRSWIEN